MVYVNVSYIQSGEFVDFNNTLDIKDGSTVNMIKELKDTLHGRLDIVGFSNGELNDIFSPSFVINVIRLYVIQF